MDDDKLRLGFIGLGLMGQGFIRRLIALGHGVCGFDIDAGRIEEAVGQGMAGARSAAEAAEKSAVVLVCVNTSEAVEEAVFGPQGVARGARPGTVLVDLSTTEAGRTRAMAQRLREEAQMAWVDAPVSGGPAGAAAGTLAIMAGGGADDIAKIGTLMAGLSASFTHFGPPGAGQVAKMVNQILVLNNYAVLAEALALAEAGGIDAAKIPAALAAGHAGSNLLGVAYPRMLARDYAPQGFARQVLKDLDMVHDLAKQLGTPTPMSSQTANLYRILNAKGHADLDGVAIHKLYDPNETL